MIHRPAIIKLVDDKGMGMIWQLILTVAMAVSLHSGCVDKERGDDRSRLRSCEERSLVSGSDGCVEAEYAIKFDYRSGAMTIEIVRHHDDGRDSSPYLIRVGDPAYDKAVTVDVTWRCDDDNANSGQTQATIPENAASVQIPLSQVAGFTQCEFKAEAVIPYVDPRDGKERTISIKTVEEIILDANVEEIILGANTNIMLKVDNIVAGDPISAADITVSLVDSNGDLIESGNDLFDNDVSIDIRWYCARLAGYPSINGVMREIMSSTYVLAAGSAEGTTQIQLGSDNMFGFPGVKCSVSAVANFKSMHQRSGDTPFVIGSPQLDVEVIEAEQGEAFVYRVGGAELNALVFLRLVSPLEVACRRNLKFVYFPAADTSITYGTGFYGTSSSDNRLFLLRTGRAPPSRCAGISLVATTGSGNSRKLGYDSAAGFFAAKSPPSPLTLDKSNATISPMRNHRGKVWVFPYDENENSSNLVGYADIDSAGSTRLKASTADNAGNATLDSSKEYIVFAEVGGELQVFLM